jgi:ABC-type lipoprotein export system ATPase subunit
MIKLVNVYKSYKEHTVLNDFSYCFNNNGLYLIVGRSGIGKTTLLNLISGYDNSYYGNIYKDNDVTYLRVDDLVGNFTVRENIELIKDLTFEYKEDKEMYGLNTLLDKKVDTLSLGEKKRLVFYLSIASNKKIILLDEPLSNLDYYNKKILVKKIMRESKKRLFIVVSHEISDFKDYTLIDLEKGINNCVNDGCCDLDYKKQNIAIDTKKWGNILLRKSFFLLLIFVMSISAITFSFKQFKNELLEFKQAFLDSYAEGNLLYKPNNLILTYENFYNGVVVNLANEIKYYGSSLYSHRMYEDSIYLDKYYFGNGFLFSNVYMGEGIKNNEVVVSVDFHEFCRKNNISACNKKIIKENLIGKKFKYIGNESYEYEIKEIVEGENLIYVNDVSKIKSILLTEYIDYVENYYIVISDSKLSLFYKKINSLKELLKYDFYEYYSEGQDHYFFIQKAKHEYFSYDEIENNNFISCSSIISCSAFDYLNLKGLYYIDNIDVHNIIKFEKADLNLNDDEIVISSALSTYLNKTMDNTITLKYYLYDSFYNKNYKIKEIINDDKLVIYSNYKYLYSLVYELSGKADRIEYVVGDSKLYKSSNLIYSEVIEETKNLVFEFLTIVNRVIYTIYLVMIILIFMIEHKRNKKWYGFHKLLENYRVYNRRKINDLLYGIYFMMFFIICIMDIYFSFIYLLVLLVFLSINKIKIQVSLD